MIFNKLGQSNDRIKYVRRRLARKVRGEEWEAETTEDYFEARAQRKKNWCIKTEKHPRRVVSAIPWQGGGGSIQKGVGIATTHKCCPQATFISRLSKREVPYRAVIVSKFF